jgi:hypothetical protein
MEKSFNVTIRAAATTNITGTYSTLVASLAKEAHAVMPAFTANGAFVLGIGPTGSEVDHITISGGTSTGLKIPCHIPAGSQVSIKTIGGTTISTNSFAFTFFT